MSFLVVQHKFWWRACLTTALIFSFIINSVPASALIPSDPLYREQWYLPKVHAESAWDISTGSPDVVIAIIDSGVDIDNPDLKSNLWMNPAEIAGNKIDDDHNGRVDDINGWDFLRNVPDPRPKIDEVFTVPGVQHGTLIAGIAAASGSNAEGVTGVSFQSKIMALRVLDGRGIGDTEKVVQALDYAVVNGADVVNLSFVGSSVSQPLIDAIERAYAAGVVIVAPSGNDRESGGLDLDVNPRFPVCHDDGKNLVIGVAALDERDQRATFSNYGTKCVDVSAPGTSLYSTQVVFSGLADWQNPYGGWWSGTSLAAPVVTGTVALMRAVNPRLAPKQIIEIIRTTADSIVSQNPTQADKLGGGRLNVAAAVQAAKDTTGVGGRQRFVRRAEYIAASVAVGGGPQVNIYTYDGRLVSQFFAYEQNFRGGVVTTLIDTDGDGVPEIITVPGPGHEPLVRVFDFNGKMKTEFYGYAANMRSGMQVAAGDVDGDGRQEIILSPRAGGGPHVRIFSPAGEIVGQFMAFATSYRGGVRTTATDIDNDGRDEILVYQSVGGDGKVHIMRMDGRERFAFSVFGRDYRGDAAIAAGDIDGDGVSEIVVGLAVGTAPYARVFDRSGSLVRQITAYDQRFTKGINVALVDIDGDGRQEIVTGPRTGGGPHVRVFSGDGFLRAQFFAFPPAFRGGINVAGG